MLPWCPVIKNWPSNAGNLGSIPILGRFYMLQGLCTLMYSSSNSTLFLSSLFIYLFIHFYLLFI